MAAALFSAALDVAAEYTGMRGWGVPRVCRRVYTGVLYGHMHRFYWSKRPEQTFLSAVSITVSERCQKT